MKFCLIYNKKSAGGRKSKFIKKILEEISNHHKVDLFETSSESEASEVIKNFEINNYDRLLVAGGDGSVSFAINELIKIISNSLKTLQLDIFQLVRLIFCKQN